MGADGGTIPKRCELVKNKKKKEKIDRNVRNASRWRLCHLSQQPLQKPIVACRLGSLYNKEAVLQAILLKTIRENESTKHIRALKDIKELKLCDNKEYKETGADKGDVYKDYNVAPYCCPVSGLTMNGNHTFMVNWRCGCVISEKAIEEVKSDVCHGCGGPFCKDDLVVLNPPSELRKVYEAKLEEEREKKNRKAQHQNGVNGNLKQTKAENTDSSSKQKPEKRKMASIQDDERASAAYKSLFTTSEEAKKRPKGHWVTYNPLFN
uniref:Replication termination factor 2 n=1 Tax=Parascaris univalens TaxID=6257 RepID=A0A915AM62_PARUN